MGALRRRGVLAEPDGVALLALAYHSGGVVGVFGLDLVWIVKTTRSQYFKHDHTVLAPGLPPLKNPTPKKRCH